jgi:uncharacterized protein YjbI with pentapeptide repeats
MMTGEMEEKKGTCKYPMHDGKPCGRELYDDKHCIFHSEDIEGKKEKFNDAFRKEFERQSIEEDEYNFHGFVFPGDFGFPGVIFKKRTSFDNAKFNGKAEFDNVKFVEEASFCGAEFNREALFRSSQFKVVNFAKAKFSGNIVNFAKAKFSGNTEFVMAEFFSGAIFFEVKFFKGVNMTKTEFYSGADFKDTQFFNEANFKGAKFTSIRYNIKDLEENIDKCRNELTELQATDEKAANDALFGIMKASSKEYQIITMQDKLSKLKDMKYDIFDEIEAYAFNRVKFKEEANFEDITIGKYNNFEMKDTYFYNVSGLFEFIEENKKKFKYSNKTEFLPDNFRLILGEEATARYPIISRKIRDDMYLLKFKEKHPKVLFIWWLFADCGRSFLRWALWASLFAVLFAFIYHNVFFLNNPTTFYQTNINIHETWPGFSFLYYSIVTFTTLGFGDIVPKPGLPQFFVALEVILGYIMLGGLISILANKLARRS